MRYSRVGLLFSIAFFFSLTASAQNAEDPLAGNEQLGSPGGEKQLYLMWTELARPSSTANVSHQSHRLVHDGVEMPPRFEASSVDTTKNASGAQQIDVISADFTGDFVDEVMTVWETNDRSLQLRVPIFDPDDPTSFDNLVWNINNLDPDTTPRVKATDGGGKVRLAAINVTPDQESEIVLAYFSDRDSVKVMVFDVDRTLKVERLASTNVLNFLPDDEVEAAYHFALASDDFDGDGLDEIVVAGGQYIECGTADPCWELSVTVLSMEGTATLVTAASTTIQADEFSDYLTGQDYLGRIDLTTGDFDGDGAKEIAVGYAIFESIGGGGAWYLRTLDVEESASGFNLIPGDLIKQDGSSQTLDGFPLSLAAGDVDLDGKDEIVFAARDLSVFSADSTLTLQLVAEELISRSETSSMSASHRILGVGDLDADYAIARGDSVLRPEIVIAYSEVSSSSSDFTSSIVLKAFHYVPGAFDLTAVSSIEHSFDDLLDRNVFFTMGSLANSSMRLGTPKRYTETNIVEPIAIINAPPTHFDIIDGIPYDISFCYNLNTCRFAATYQSQTTQSIRIETVFNRDWSVGAKAGGGFKIPFLKIGVEAKLGAKYGRYFSKQQGEFESFSVSQTVSAIADDWIYAVVMDYDIWEYPILIDGEIEGYVSVVEPRQGTERAWFDSKSFSASSYIPSHEVGNILSYSEIAAPEENAFLAEAVRWNTGDRITLNNNSSLTWTLTSESGQSTSAVHRETKSLGGSLDFEIPAKIIPDLGIEGDYASSLVSTYSTQVVDQTGLSVRMESIDLSAGNTRFAVTPYVYWATNGALVLDYAVRPELPSNSADPATWWTQNYGRKADPAFILPWRYDPEKGLGLDSEAQRYRTRDILFSPAVPRSGEVVTIQARIQNFSLIPTDTVVTVQFYLDDPDDGGMLLENTSGLTTVSTQQRIDARGEHVVAFDWLVPDGIGASERIYVVLDPTHQIDEIHENNNKGWAVLGVEGEITINEQEDLPYGTFSLEQNYPNPFSSSTTIEYAIPYPTTVSMVVYDMLGRVVARLVDEDQASGAYRTSFTAHSLASGVYVLRLTAGEYTETKRILLVK